MDAADENTQLKGDFQPREIGENSAEQDETDDGVEMNEAIEKVGAGCGTFLYSLGPFLMFALEGGEVIVLSIVGLMVKCEWNLSTFWVAVLQVSCIVPVHHLGFTSTFIVIIDVQFLPEDIEKFETRHVTSQPKTSGLQLARHLDWHVY